jgi:acyl-CoA thioester hydrolase
MAALAESRIRVQLRWRDLDVLGHLNQAVYHELLEEGRGGILARGNRTFPFVLAHVELDYQHEVRRSDEYVEIVTSVARLGRTSVTLDERIELPSGELAASGQAVLVAWDMEARAARPLTDEEREAYGG